MNPMKPGAAVLTKLGRAIIHLQNYMDTDLHSQLKNAQEDLESPEVQEWLGEMTGKGLMPERIKSAE